MIYRDRSDFMEKDFNNNYMPPFMDYGMPPPNMGMDMNDLYKDPMFNPIMQYEQAYCYYKYLCMQMDYKLKCKEYEKVCNNSSNNSNNRERKIE